MPVDILVLTALKDEYDAFVTVASTVTWEKQQAKSGYPYVTGQLARETGTPLTLANLPGDEISLSWGNSCSFDDLDYEIYEGTIGDFYSHTARLCSTGGSTTATFAPAAGDTYYLVVPTNASREGSYGIDGDGNPRPQGEIFCLPQTLGACR